MNSKTILLKAKDYKLNGNGFKSVSDAYNKAKFNAKKDDLIFIGGSTFVVAEVI
jgi:dihydrofolate synthase/folylpolyglutamate synthase